VAVPANRRDSRRLHRVQAGDTLPGLAKRYNAQTALVSSANRESMAEVGEWMAIPVAYPGDRAAASKTVARKKTGSTASSAHKKPATPARATAASKTVSNKPAASKSGVNKPVASKASAKTPVRHSGSSKKAV
jgi:hypothetical protein